MKPVCPSPLRLRCGKVAILACLLLVRKLYLISSTRRPYPLRYGTVIIWRSPILFPINAGVSWAIHWSLAPKPCCHIHVKKFQLLLEEVFGPGIISKILNDRAGLKKWDRRKCFWKSSLLPFTHKLYGIPEVVGGIKTWVSILFKISNTIFFIIQTLNDHLNWSNLFFPTLANISPDFTVEFFERFFVVNRGQGLWF